jgi:GT2 family glycosyltransferase
MLRDQLPWQELLLSCRVVKCLKNARNLGYGAGHNRVISVVNSDYHLVLNPDVLLDIKSLSLAIEYLADNSDAVAITPLAEDLAGNRQYLAKRSPTVLDFLLRGFAPEAIRQYFSKRLSRYEYRGEAEQQVLSNIEIMSGCFIFCRTDVLQQLGGFDESWFLYFEDFDLSQRLHDVGHIAYVPTVKIIHEGGNAANKGFSHLKMFAVSAFKYFYRYGWRLW